MSDGFLGRWSQRKRDAQAGRLDGDAPRNDMRPVVASPTEPLPLTESVESTPSQYSPEREPPTLADTVQLTPDSDFQPFMAKDVASEVRNAAMKKLFTDPHFNVMDRMDVYIDDYGQPDPIPQAMLRQMVSAKFLNLFEDEDDEKKDAHANLNDIPSANDTQVVAQSVPAATISKPEPLTHDHTDLRLQPDPAPRPEGAGSKPV